MTETVITANSTYEIDRELKRVRRIQGTNSPTERFGADGVWHQYHGIEETFWGGLVFWWDEDHTRCTMTTPAEAD